MRTGPCLVPVFCLAPLVFPATVEHIAGGGTGAPGARAREIRFVEPFGVAFDKRGNGYVVEFKGNRVVRIDPQGNTHAFAGNGTPGFSGDGGPATAAQLNEPHGVVVSRDQKLYIADTHNNRVRRVDLRTGIIDTIAGNGEAGYSGDGGPAVRASFKGVFAIDLAPRGDRLYIADLSNRRVRMVDLRTGIVTTVAGNGASGVPQDGARAAASPLVDPRAVAADRKGNVYILERQGNALRVVGKDGTIRTLIGPRDLEPGLKGPKHLCVDRDGGVVIADAENHLVRRYSPETGKTVSLAGTARRGDRIAPADPLSTELARPHGVFAHPGGALYIADSYNHRILRLNP